LCLFIFISRQQKFLDNVSRFSVKLILRFANVFLLRENLFRLSYFIFRKNNSKIRFVFFQICLLDF